METRREILDFGLLPLGLILPAIDSIQSVTELHTKLLSASRQLEGRKGVVDLQVLLGHLNVTPSLWEVLYDALEAVSNRSVGFKWPGNADIHSIDAHALCLYLLAQLYGRQLSRGDHEEQWHEKSDKDQAQQRRTVDQGNSHHTAINRPLTPTRAHSILSFPSFLRKHIQVLLFLVMDQPPPLTSSAWAFSRAASPCGPPGTNPRSDDRLWITAAEVDRLGLLLRPKDSSGIMNGMGGPGSRVPGIGEWKRLSSWLPLFRGKPEGHQVACEEVAAWLVANVLDNDFDHLLNEGSEEGVDEHTVRIKGMTKGTVVRGEDGFPNKQLIVDECQDSCVYSLAPLSLSKISNCTDCTIVVGAVGCLVVDNLTRVRIICACRRAYISSCHECTLHLGTNRSPVLMGDNRFVHLAPYNTTYERLPVHMGIVGITGSPNVWDKPIVLSIDRPSMELSIPAQGGARIGNGTGSSSTPTSAKVSEEKEAQRAKAWLLPPEKLLPFTIPFKGSAGSLAGGSSTMSQFSWLGKGGVGSPGMGRMAGLPFALPAPYSDAMHMKLRKVSELQEAVGKAIVDSANRRDLHVAIQGYFKDWLFSSGRIRQVYDLAKLEQQTIAERKGLGGSRSKEKKSANKSSGMSEH